ncbi:MAG: helix-hairpin-helix domain-containing protein [bacterium]|nr:helix-hairpin-helix domain-containing protein [bacterium]
MNEPSPRGVIAAFILVALAVVGGGVLLFTTRPESVQIVVNPPVPTSTPLPSATPAPLSVYVTGAVANPQTTVQVPPGSRVEDVIEAAGGFSDEADLDRVNLAGLVRDGDQIHVFSRAAEIEPESVEALPTASTSGLVNVNTATLEELDTLPGVGPALAQAVIDYREANGPFADLAGLDEVSGIGPALLEDLGPLVTFE